MIEPARACVRACVRARACCALCAARCTCTCPSRGARCCRLLVAAGERLPADPCCSQRFRLTPRFASASSAQRTGPVRWIVAGAVTWSTSLPGGPWPWRALVLCMAALLPIFSSICIPCLYWNVSLTYASPRAPNLQKNCGNVAPRLPFYQQGGLGGGAVTITYF
jgi:hypothetical protein